MKVTLKTPYTYAPDGNNTITVGPGECDLPERFAKKAKAAGIVEEKAARPPANKSRGNAPRNKSG